MFGRFELQSWRVVDNAIVITDTKGRQYRSDRPGAPSDFFYVESGRYVLGTKELVLNGWLRRIRWGLEDTKEDDT